MPGVAQGGLLETGLAPVQAAVNHVTTMTVDGQNRDLVNYWQGVGLSREAAVASVQGTS